MFLITIITLESMHNKISSKYHHLANRNKQKMLERVLLIFQYIEIHFTLHYIVTHSTFHNTDKHSIEYFFS